MSYTKTHEKNVKKICGICLEVFSDIISAPDSCRDLFHYKCLRKYVDKLLEKNEAIICPVTDCKKLFNRISNKYKKSDEIIYQKVLLSTDETQCGICFSKYKVPVASSDACSHTFCFDCIKKWCTFKHECPMDRMPIKKLLVSDFPGGHIITNVKPPAIEQDLTADDDNDVSINTICEVCNSGQHEDQLLLCDCCDRGYHIFCLPVPLETIPEGDWYCNSCQSRNITFNEIEMMPSRRLPRGLDRLVLVLQNRFSQSGSVSNVRGSQRSRNVRVQSNNSDRRQNQVNNNGQNGNNLEARLNLRGAIGIRTRRGTVLTAISSSEGSDSSEEILQDSVENNQAVRRVSSTHAKRRTNNIRRNVNTVTPGYLESDLESENDNRTKKAKVAEISNSLECQSDNECTGSSEEDITTKKDSISIKSKSREKKRGLSSRVAHNESTTSNYTRRRKRIIKDSEDDKDDEDDLSQPVLRKRRPRIDSLLLRDYSQSDSSRSSSPKDASRTDSSSKLSTSTRPKTSSKRKLLCTSIDDEEDLEAELLDLQPSTSTVIPRTKKTVTRKTKTKKRRTKRRSKKLKRKTKRARSNIMTRSKLRVKKIISKAIKYQKPTQRKLSIRGRETKLNMPLADDETHRNINRVTAAPSVPSSSKSILSAIDDSQNKLRNMTLKNIQRLSDGTVVHKPKEVPTSVSNVSPFKQPMPPHPIKERLSAEPLRNNIHSDEPIRKENILGAPIRKENLPSDSIRKKCLTAVTSRLQHLPDKRPREDSFLVAPLRKESLSSMNSSKKNNLPVEPAKKDTQPGVIRSEEIQLRVTSWKNSLPIEPAKKDTPPGVVVRNEILSQETSWKNNVPIEPVKKNDTSIEPLRNENLTHFWSGHIQSEPPKKATLLVAPLRKENISTEPSRNDTGPAIPPTKENLPMAHVRKESPPGELISNHKEQQVSSRMHNLQHQSPTKKILSVAPLRRDYSLATTSQPSTSSSLPSQLQKKQDCNSSISTSEIEAHKVKVMKFVATSLRSFVEDRKINKEEYATLKSRIVDKVMTKSISRSHESNVKHFAEKYANYFLSKKNRAAAKS